MRGMILLEWAVFVVRWEVEGGGMGMQKSVIN